MSNRCAIYSLNKIRPNSVYSRPYIVATHTDSDESHTDHVIQYKYIFLIKTTLLYTHISHSSAGIVLCSTQIYILYTNTSIYMIYLVSIRRKVNYNIVYGTILMQIVMPKDPLYYILCIYAQSGILNLSSTNEWKQNFHHLTVSKDINIYMHCIAGAQ